MALEPGAQSLSTCCCRNRGLYFLIRFAHERIAATLMGLSELERQLIEADAKFKGKPRKPESRQTKGIEALEAQKQEMLKILNADSKK